MLFLPTAPSPSSSLASSSRPMSISISKFIVLVLSIVLFLCTSQTECKPSQWISGGSGYALSYNGRSPKLVYVQSTCGGNLFSVNSVTLEAWVFITGPKWNLPVTEEQTVFTENSYESMQILGLGWEQGYELQYDVLTDTLGFQTQGSNLANNCYLLSSNTPPTSLWSVWTHVAVTFDQVTGLKQMYVNGTLNSWANCSGGVINVGVSALTVGGRRATPTSVVSSFFGLIDEVRVWKIARSASDILSWFNRALTPDVIPLVSPLMLTYLPFDDVDPVNTIDAAHIGSLLALNGSLGVGPMDTAPTRVASSAPLVGAALIQTFRQGQGAVTTTGTGTGTTASFQILAARQDSVSASVSMIQNPSVVVVGTDSPSTLSQVLSTKSSSSASSVQVTLFQPITPPFIVSTVKPISFSFNYTLVNNNIVNASTTNVVYTVYVTVKPNRAPLTGGPGSALYCDGVNDYALANSFEWAQAPPFGAGPVTVTFWAQTLKANVGQTALFSVGNSELVGSWCPNNPPGEPFRCGGRFHAHIPWVDGNLGWHYGWVSGLKGAVQVSETPYLASWTHFALTSSGQGGLPLNLNRTANVYANGQLIGSVPADSPIGNVSLKGLLMCDWRYWSPLPHKGAIDDFRIYNRVLSPSEISALMYTRSTSNMNDPSLMVAYNFDEDPSDTSVSVPITQATSSSSSSSPSSTTSSISFPTYAIDQSGNNAHLVFGACNSVETMTGPHAGVPHCNGPLTQNPVALPSRVRPLSVDLPLSGAEFTQVGTPASLSSFSSQSPVDGSTIPFSYQATIAPSGTVSVTNLTNLMAIPINGTDPDGDALKLIITQYPDRGTLYAQRLLLSTAYASNNIQFVALTTVNGEVWGDPLAAGAIALGFAYSALSGGSPFTNFSYTLSDGLLSSSSSSTVTISIPCTVGYYLVQETRTCRPCAPGTYQPQAVTFATQCTPCSIGSAQPSSGQSACNVCGVSSSMYQYLSNTSNVNSSLYTFDNNIYTSLLQSSFVNQQFQSSAGASSCINCKDADYPANVCPTPTDVTTQSQSAWQAVTIVLLLACAAVSTVILLYRGTRVMFSSSILLMLLSIAGVALCLASIFVIITPLNTIPLPSNASQLCLSRHLLFHMGLSLLLFPIALKLFRLHRIFNLTKLRKSRAITDSKLVLVVAAAVVMDCAIVAVWAATMPYTLAPASPTTLANCQSNGLLLFSILLFAPKVLALLSCIYLAAQTRSIPETFNESSSVLSFSGCAAISGFILLMLLVGSSSISPRTYKSVVCAIIAINAAAAITVLYARKVYVALRYTNHSFRELLFDAAMTRRQSSEHPNHTKKSRSSHVPPSPASPPSANDRLGVLPDVITEDHVERRRVSSGGSGGVPAEAAMKSRGSVSEATVADTKPEKMSSSQLAKLIEQQNVRLSAKLTQRDYIEGEISTLSQSLGQLTFEQNFRRRHKPAAQNDNSRNDGSNNTNRTNNNNNNDGGSDRLSLPDDVDVDSRRRSLGSDKNKQNLAVTHTPNRRPTATRAQISVMTGNANTGAPTGAGAGVEVERDREAVAVDNELTTRPTPTPSPVISDSPDSNLSAANVIDLNSPQVHVQLATTNNASSSGASPATAKKTAVRIHYA